MPGTSAKYLIAQYLRDPFRREPRNVGIVVIKGDDVGARFLAESAPGEVDGRRIRKWQAHPPIYRRWIDYWREQVARSSPDSLGEKLINGKPGNFVVIEGGEIEDTGDDSAATICGFLYSALVDDPPTGASIDVGDDVDEAEPVAQLKKEVRSAFKTLDILSSSSRRVPNPIQSDQDLLGARTTHKAPFVQYNGAIWVMEFVNFITPKQATAKEHSALVANLFADVMEKNDRTRPIAIIQAGPDELKGDSMEYLRAFSPTTTEYVNWYVEAERQRFLSERERIAMTAPDDHPRLPL